MGSLTRYLRFHRVDVAREVDDELRFHLDARYEEFRALGLSPEEARAEAERRLGNLGPVREQCISIDNQWQREATMSDMVRNALADLRYALRQLRRSPTLAASAILCVALGIGANTSVFSVVSAVLIRPLPFAKPDQLVVVSEGIERIGGNTGRISAPDYLDYRELVGSAFAELAIYDNASFVLRGRGDPERLSGASVSWTLFPMLGVRPAIGRGFIQSDEAEGAPFVTILSDQVWRSRFDADPGVIGRAISLGSANVTVVGVLPPSFGFPIGALGQPALLFVPNRLTQSRLNLRGDNYGTVLIGRLAPGISRERATAALDRIAVSFPQRYPATYGKAGASRITVQVRPFSEILVGTLRPALLVLLAAVGFVLLIACINVTSLLLARAAARRREIAVRRALGASQGRLAQQFFAESIVLVGLGGVLGLLFARWGTRALLALDPAGTLATFDVGIDWRVLLFTLVVTLATGLVFSVLPGLRGDAGKLSVALTDEARTSASPSRLRSRRGLVMAEIALALILAVGAGLMIKSFVKLRAVDPGFRPENVLTFSLYATQQRYPDMQEALAFQRRVMERIRLLPGVRQVSGATSVPTAPPWLIVFTPEGPPLSNSPVGYSTVVHPGFFETLGVPLRAGRVFTEQDRAGTDPVAVISESVARRFWPNESAIGKRLHQGNAENNMPWRTIVGVVADVKQGGLDESQPMSIYMPTLQLDTGLVTSITRGTAFVVRSDRDPAALVNPIRAIVRELDPTLPIGTIQPLETMLASTVASRRFNVLLLGTFAAIALALAAIGTYGLMAFAVAQRTREIGIRLAIGAAPRDVLRLVVRQGLALAIAGVGLGLLGALLLTRVLRSLLFEVNPLDPTTFGAVAVLLLGVSLMASILPAQRAARIDPNSAIRQE